MQHELNIKKIENTNGINETMRDELQNAMDYIKQLEQRIYETENTNNEKKPTKKVNKRVKPNEDFEQTAEGTLLNKTTGKTYEITQMDDDEKIF